jgi:transposase
MEARAAKIQLSNNHRGGSDMAQFVGLDVSIKETSICIVDEMGIVLWEGRRASEPSVLASAIRRYAPEAVRVGLETGPTSAWHWHGLRDLGVPIVCVDARHAKAALSMRLNKSDKNDAHGLAEIMRTGWYREVKVKSLQSHGIQALLGARARLVKVRHELANQIRATLMGVGLRVPNSRGRGFADQVEAIVREHNWLAPLIEPLVLVWRRALEQVAAIDRRLRAIARAHPDCRVADDSARRRRDRCARLCGRGRRPLAFRRLEQRRRLSRVDSSTISIRRG